MELLSDSVEPQAPELRLLMALARIRITDAVAEHCRKVVAQAGGDFRWGLFVEQATRHGVLPLIGRNLTRYALKYTESGHLVRDPWVLSAAYQHNRARNLGLFDEFAVIFRALNRHGISYAVRKGPVLCEQVYRDPAARRMSDLDLLIAKSDAPGVGRVLTELGYAQGKQAADGRTIVPFDRETQLFWKVSVNNELPFLKISHLPEADTFEVDLCTDIFSKKSPASAPVEEILRRASKTVLCGEESSVPAPADTILDLCAHLHKEAVSLFYVERGLHLTLRKFLDVALAVEAFGTPEVCEELVERVGLYGAAEPAYYALHFADQLYPGTIPDSLLDALRPDDLNFLEEYGSLDGRPVRWAEPFADRLFRLAPAPGASGPGHVPYSW